MDVEPSAAAEKKPPPTTMAMNGSSGGVDGDMAKLAEDAIARGKDTAKSGNLAQAIEELLQAEKKMRLGGLPQETRDVSLCIVNLCYDAKNWQSLSESVMLLSKRRAQLKSVVSAVVKRAIELIEETPDLKTKEGLIRQLNQVTAGKIYLEIERARLVKKLASMKEAEGGIAEAAEIMMEVAVETFGAMARTEKVFFILEQIRLLLENKDYVRAQIYCKKINPRSFSEDRVKKDKEKESVPINTEAGTIQEAESGTPKLEELRIMYYKLLIRYHNHDNDYLELTRAYLNIYETPSIKESDDLWQSPLSKACLFLALTPMDNHRADLLVRVTSDKKLKTLTELKDFLETFLSKEIIRWDILFENFQGILEENSEVFAGADRDERLKDLKTRVVQHDISVLAGYYSCIKLDRLSTLINLDKDETEKHVSTMVVGQVVQAKIDRPRGIVTFGGRRDTMALLNAWGQNIDELLNLVEKSCSQISKEVKDAATIPLRV